MADSDPNLALLNGPAPVAAPAPTASDPNLALLNGFSTAPDANLTALNGPTLSSLSDTDFQQKLPRWGPILAGQSMGSPADWTEMQASGRFTREQIQRAQLETSLRQNYLDQTAQAPLTRAAQGAWSALKNIGSSIASIPKLAAGIADVTNPTVPKLAAGIAGDTDPTGLVSSLEGSSQAATGLLGMGADLGQGVKSAYGQVTGAPKNPEQDYQNWKLNYLATHAVPGYAPPSTSSRVQDLAAALTGKPAAAFPAPDEGMTSAANLLASTALFGGAGKVAETILPKVLEATGTAEAASKYAPTLANIGSPAEAQAAKIRNAMNEAVEPGSTPLLAKDVTAPVANAVSGAQSAVLNKAGQAVSGAGKAASWIADKINSIPGIKTTLGDYFISALTSPGGLLAAKGAISGLEKLGPKAADIGDFMSRVASADPAYSRFAALAEDATAPDWMKRWAQNPAIKATSKLTELAGGAVKGGLVNAAVGTGAGVLTSPNPEDIGASAANFGAFGALGGALSARDGKIFDANVGSVTKYIGDALQAGIKPDTLRLVSASDLMQAAQMRNAHPNGYTARPATANDPGTPFAPGGTAFGQAGFDDPVNKVAWFDPTKRDAGSTILHENYHPIFDNLISERPEIKSTLDNALKTNGSSIDAFKKEYALKVTGGDDQAAAQFMANREAGNPDWGYSEMLAESAAHNLNGRDLLEAMQGRDVQQTATQTALDGVQGWLSDAGVKLKQGLTPGTIFPHFEDALSDPGVRRLTYKLLKAQRDTRLGKLPAESPGVPLTTADMGTPKAPTYDVGGRQINRYGEMVPDPTSKTGFKFVRASAAEVRRRGKAESDAISKYFPEVGKLYTTMPAGLMDDPNITPWTKESLRNAFDSIQNKNKLSFWYHRMNDGNSATAEASALKRDGNARVSWQEGQAIGVHRSSKNNLNIQMHSEAAENQKLAAWASEHGDISLDLWGGDQAKAKADIQVYLHNHAVGLPGETGIGIDKRNTIDAFLGGDNKQFQEKNPLRKKLKGANRQAVIRDIRPDRQGSIASEPSERAPLDWTKVKHNLSPGDLQAKATSFSPSESAKRDIELTGPDGKKYPATYGGIQETLDPKAPWLTITPKVDLPGAAAANSTTYAHSLATKGYSVPPELLNELKNHVAAQP